MSSICPKCKFLLTCNTLYKDSVIECEDFKNNDSKERMDKRLERMHEIERRIGCTGRKEKLTTNADRLRVMSDEELANFLTDDFCELLCGSPLFCGGQCREKCLEWLKKENDE